MPTNPYSADIYSSQLMPGGGLGDMSQYVSSGPQYVDRPTYTKGGGMDVASFLTGGVGGLLNKNTSTQDKVLGILSGGFSSLFGGDGDKKSSLPRWQQLANKEWSQGNAALSAYARLYEPTLNMARRQAADYGDLYRRASNDQLAFDLRSATTKRRGDLNDFQQLGGDYVNQLRATNPLLAQYYDTAQSNLALGSKLSPEQEAEIASQVRQGQAARGMGRGPTDVYQEMLQKTTFGEQMRQQRMQEARGATGLYGDIFQATTGRPTMSATPMGATIQAPDASIGLQDYLSMGINFDQQRVNANAASKAQNKQLLGAGIQTLGSLGGMAAGLCWVAREVYGEASPKWREFRRYLITKAPAALLRGYLRKGEAFADWLAAHPERKPDIRAWMDECVEAAAA